MTKIQAKNRVRNVTRSFHFREIHPHDLKKQGGKRFPSQFHRSNFIQNFTKNEISVDIFGFSAQWSILGWFVSDFL